ncbi:MAG: GNAT family N-acetyltransferase [Promethearchaeota archaeon]
MKIIKLDASFEEKYKKIINLSFPPEDEVERIWTDIFFKHKDIWDDTFGYVDEDILASVFSSYSGKIHIRNSDFQVKYIENVATLPPYRGKGK